MFSQRRVFLISALLLGTQFFTGCSTPKESLSSDVGTTETTESDSTFNDTASDLISSGTLNNDSQSASQPSGTVSTASQASCLNGTNFTPGFGGTSSFSDFGVGTSNTGTGTGTGTATLNNNTRSQCLASGMTNQTAADIGMGSYNMAATCMQVSSITMATIKQGSTGPNLRARRAAGQAFMACLQQLVQRQAGAANWSQQSQTAFENSNFNLNQFGNQLGNFNF